MGPNPSSSLAIPSISLCSSHAYCPNAAAGYVLFLRAVELLLELLGPAEPPLLPGGGVGDRRLELLLLGGLFVPAANGF